MANQYFQFKQFTVNQDKTAMKVCTDACLFGAWVAKYFEDLFQEEKPQRILDIGTGTGLLSLMLAQKLNGPIDAIEIDKSAAMQAQENVQVSPWMDHVHVITGDVKSYAFTYSYDLIVSNPPFYENDLKSGNSAKDQAMHDTGLTMEALIRITYNCMNAMGYFAVLIPAHRRAYILSLAEKNKLRLIHQLLVKPTPKHAPTRVILLFQKRAEDESSILAVTEEMNIKEVHHSYSLNFIQLLEDYYLSL